MPCLNFTVNLYCDAVFSRINLVIVDSKYAVKLKAFSTSRYIRRRVLGNDSTPDMFSSYLLPCIYQTIRYVQMEISLVLMLSRKQTNASPVLPPN